MQLRIQKITTASVKVVRMYHREKQDLSISLSHRLTYSLNLRDKCIGILKEEEEEKEEADILTTTE